MSTLLLRLSGPLQSWGVRSKYTRRDTAREPTKSGVIGMLAAARGVERTDPIPDDLLSLRFGVRTDQPGTIMSDFQTARRLDGSSLPLSYRHYLADAKFLVALEGDGDVLEDLQRQLLRPAFPLYLGRRSCPPGAPVIGTLDERGLADVLQRHEWIVGDAYARTQPKKVVLSISRDVLPEELATGNIGRLGATVRDVPISFAPEHRRHGWRVVVPDRVEITNPLGRNISGRQSAPPHEPAAFGD